MGDKYNALLGLRLLYNMKSYLNFVADHLGNAAVSMVIAEYNVPQAKGQVQLSRPHFNLV